MDTLIAYSVTIDAVDYTVLARSKGEALGLVLLQNHGESIGDPDNSGFDIGDLPDGGVLVREVSALDRKRHQIHDDGDGEVHSIAHYMDRATGPEVIGCSEW